MKILQVRPCNLLNFCLKKKQDKLDLCFFLSNLDANHKKTRRGHIIISVQVGRLFLLLPEEINFWLTED